MRIFFLTFEFPPRFGGGLATYLAEVCRLYAGRGDEVTVISAEDGLDGDEVEETLGEGVRVLRFAIGRTARYAEFGHWPALADDIADRAAALARRDGAPDVIEIPDGFGLGYFVLQRRLTLDPLFSRTPVVCVAHTPTYMIDRLNDQPTFQLPVYWQGVMEKFSLLAADMVVSPSQALVSRLEADLRKPLDARVVRNPYRVPDAPIQAGGPADHFYMASRLAYWKGAEHLPRIFQRAWAEGLEAPLRMYGGDTMFAAAGRSMSEHLRARFAAEIAAGRLELCGQAPRAEIDAQSRTAYAQVHPSLFDNFPYSVVESMALGQVTLVNCDGGHNEILSGDDAVRMDVTDIEGAARAVLDIAAMSAEERRRMGEAARETIRRACDPDAFYQTKQALYQEVIDRKDGRRSFPFVAGPEAETERLRVVGEPDLLSVVIPYFNMHDFIDETLESVFASTYPSIEVVLVDDGSPAPEAQAKLVELEKRHADKRLRVLRGPNLGVAGARNKGAEAASGAMMALLDADDVVTPDYYRQAVEILRAYDNVAFVGCWNEDFRDSDGETIRVWGTWNPEPPQQLIFNLTNCQGLIYWRGAFLEAGRHDPSLRMFLDDWESTIGLMAAGWRGVMIPAPLFRYRIRDASIFRSKRGLWAVNYEKIALKHRDYYDMFGAEIAAFLNANGPNTHYHIPGVPGSYSEAEAPKREAWLAQAYELRYVGWLRHFSNFLAHSRTGRFLRTNKTARRALEKLF